MTTNEHMKETAGKHQTRTTNQEQQQTFQHMKDYERKYEVRKEHAHTYRKMKEPIRTYANITEMRPNNETERASTRTLEQQKRKYNSTNDDMIHERT